MKRDSKSVIRKYYLLCCLITIPFIALTLQIFYFFNGLSAFGLYLLLWFFFRIAIRIIARENIISALTNDLDPYKYNEIISSKWLNVSIEYKLNAAVYLRDYQTTVNIITAKLKKCSIRQKKQYLGMLACAYFELRDTEKLKIVCDKYNEYAEKHPNKVSPSSYSIIRYFKYYLDGDFNACKLICKENELVLNPKAYGAKINKMYYRFCYAVACFKNGETEEAKQIFEDIIAVYPKMSVASLSSEYLQEINEGKEYLKQEILPQQDDIAIILKKRKRYNIVLTISFVLLLAAWIVLEIKDVQSLKEMKEYDNKLNAAISEQYTDYQLVKCFNVAKNNMFYDVICVVSDSDKSIDVGFIVTYDNGETFSFIRVIDNLEDNKYHYLKSFTGEHFIGMKLYSNMTDVPKDSIKTVDIKINGKTKWICVDYIGKMQ